MMRSGRRAQRQQGAVRRWIAGVLAVSGLVILAIIAYGPGSGGAQDATPQNEQAPVLAAGGAVSTAGMQAVRTHASPRQLAIPYGYEDSGQQMFTLEPRPARPGQDGDPYPAPVRMNREAAKRAATTGAMEVTLPDGTRYPVNFERAEQGPRGNLTWVGRVETPVGSLAAVLTYGRDGVFGVLPTPDGQLLQVQTRDGRAYLQPDPGIIPPGLDPDVVFPDYVVPPAPTPRMAGAVGPSGGLAPHGAAGVPLPDAAASPVQLQPATVWNGMVAAASDDTEVEITVLGVYTTNLVDERGSAAAAETEFINQIEITNQAHIDSGTRARFNLVGLLETDYPASVFNGVLLQDLQHNRLKDGLDIHAERDAHGADLVALLRPFVSGDSNCGIANLIGGGLLGTSVSSEFGYSVNATCGGYVMAHEIGHNLGSHHDRDAATDHGVLTYGAFDFSFGYRQSASPAFGTIMSYSQGEPRVGYFSTPDNTLCLGVACGVKDQADNVRSIDLMAETISRFRDPPNTISVLGAKVVEPYGQVGHLSFIVRLSTPAPVGGVRFDIATIDGGTATAFQDYVPRTVTAQVIPEGQREWRFDVEVLPDELVEGDETVLVRLSNVSGMAVYDNEAVGLIVDDDPRDKLTGSLVFPDGEPGPDRLYVYAQPVFEGTSEWHTTEVVAPHYRFEFEVMRGSVVKLEAYMDDDWPWVTAVDSIRADGDVEHDLHVERAVWINGRVRWPAGNPAPDATMQIIAWNALGDEYGPGYFVNPPDFTYSIKARNATGVAIDVYDPPAPYVRQRIETFTFGDTEQDVFLSSVPTLSIAHKLVEEGAEGTHQTVPLQVMLSVPAPPGGVSFDLVTEDGTAAGGSDYLHESQSITIGEGNNSFHTSVVIFGDNVHEPDEYFRIVARNIEGAHMPTPGVVWIADDDTVSAETHLDFDGDGRADLLWHHARNGRVVLWSGAQSETLRHLVTVTDSDWQIAGVGDFDRDGRSDLFWRHARTGSNVIWRSGNHGTQLRVQAVTNTDWKIVGVADFDGDGQSDLLWRHMRTGANVIWRGADYRSQRPVTGVTDLNWEVAAVGDFDGDGRADILWRHARSGANVIWRQGDYRDQQRTMGVTDTRWRIVGAGDFDGDGIDDVLWRHHANGANVIWRGADYSRQTPVTAVTNLHWEVAAIADYDGDGFADIAWRDRNTGANAVWRSGNYRDQMKVTQVADQGWRIAR